MCTVYACPFSVYRRHVHVYNHMPAAKLRYELITQQFRYGMLLIIGVVLVSAQAYVLTYMYIHRVILSLIHVES